MDYVKPADIATNMAAVGAMKAKLPPSSLLLRGALAGAFLAVATSMAVTAAVQTGFPIVGALIFPFGLCLVILLGTELITGSFALLPCATADNAADWGQVIVNWGWVFLGNLLGSVGYAILLSISLTMMGSFDPLPVGQKLVKVAEAKTIGYAAHGGAGMITVFVKAILCNWMVSLAVVMALASTSVVGKMLAIWGPVMLFFSQGFEHTVVNMFVIPSGILMGANVTIGQWWMWNQIPVTLGNLVGGMFFTGLAIYLTHRPAKQAS
ncbi:MAG: formate/nitrite transporter family protein [Nitrospirales bacterium]|nr:formate/nitrite transporter family protein [Nitrospirales bacterium]